MRNGKIIEIEMRIPRLGASPRHGGARKIPSYFYESSIRRGGVPSGAVEFIVFGGMGVSTPIIKSDHSVFQREPNYLKKHSLSKTIVLPLFKILNMLTKVHS